MEDTTKKKILVIGECNTEKVGDALRAENLEVEFLEDEKVLQTHFFRPYLDVMASMQAYEFSCFKDFHDYSHPIPKRLRGLEVKSVRNSKENPKHGRNEPCSCGSGKKYKHCCFA